jgi:hypothetical protein
VTSLGPDQRTAITRALVADDARWLADAIMSAHQASKHAVAVIGLSAIGQIARVVYEGTAIARSEEPPGIPALAELLDNNHADIIARARHATKLLDDNKKSPTDLARELTTTHAEHEAEFTGNAPAFARFLESDTSIVWLNNKPLLCMHAMTLRFGFDPIIAGETAIVDITTRLGAGLNVLRAMDGRIPSFNTELDLSALDDADFRDTQLTPFLDTRYSPHLAMPTKLLLLMIECEVNIAAHLLPSTSPVGQEAVLRAQLAVAYHAARAITALANEDPNVVHGTLTSWVADPQIQTFLTEARPLRNQAVHYGVSPNVTDLDLDAPMFGLIDALWPGQTVATASQEITTVLNKTSDMLASWHSVTA